MIFSYFNFLKGLHLNTVYVVKKVFKCDVSRTVNVSPKPFWAQVFDIEGIISFRQSKIEFAIKQ